MKSSLFDLTDENVYITGTNRGIGAILAIYFKDAKARVNQLPGHEYGDLSKRQERNQLYFDNNIDKSNVLKSVFILINLFFVYLLLFQLYFSVFQLLSSF